MRNIRIKDDRLASVLAGEQLLLFDGAMGTQLQERGLAAGEIPELLCLTNPDEITQIHATYVAAGSEAVTTNTFGANRASLGSHGIAADRVEDYCRRLVALSREATAGTDTLVAGDLSPCGLMPEPYGESSEEEIEELGTVEENLLHAAEGDQKSLPQARDRELQLRPDRTLALGRRSVRRDGGAYGAGH